MSGPECNLNAGMSFVRHQGSCAQFVHAEKVFEQAKRPADQANVGRSSNLPDLRLDGANPHGYLLRPTVQPRTPQRACIRARHAYVRDGSLRRLVRIKSRLGRLGG